MSVAIARMSVDNGRMSVDNGTNVSAKRVVLGSGPRSIDRRSRASNLEPRAVPCFRTAACATFQLSAARGGSIHASPGLGGASWGALGGTWDPTGNAWGRPRTPSSTILDPVHHPGATLAHPLTPPRAPAERPGVPLCFSLAAVGAPGGRPGVYKTLGVGCGRGPDVIAITA